MQVFSENMSLIAELFEKISHPTRLKILNLLQDDSMNFSQLKNALNIESNGNLDHHLKKLDTLIYLDAGGLYKLSDDGKEAIRAVQVMEASITPKTETAATAQGKKVLYAFLAITCVFPLSVAAALILTAPSEGSTQALVGTAVGLVAVFVGLLAAVFEFRKTIKADSQSTESLTYFPSGKDPWSTGDWLRNVGFFASYLAMFSSLLYIEFSSADFPAKIVWLVLSLLALIALGFTSQSIIYAVIEKANSRIRRAQTTPAGAQ
jgi:DNA-binding transcriptional ArsR family regulator